MNRKMIAWLSLVVFCLVGAATSTIALNTYSLLLSLILTVVFGCGLIICARCLEEASWVYCVEKDENNG